MPVSELTSRDAVLAGLLRPEQLSLTRSAGTSNASLTKSAAVVPAFAELKLEPGRVLALEIHPAHYNGTVVRQGTG